MALFGHSRITCWSRQVADVHRRKGVQAIATSIFMMMLRIVSTVILTRLLDVKIFGAIGIMTSILMIVVLLSDLGIYQFVVRSKEGFEEHFLDSIWTFRLIRATLLTVLVIAIAYPVALYVKEPDLTLPIAVSALAILIEGLSSMAFATAAREQMIGRLSALDVVPAIVQLICSVLLALAYRSIWALVIAGIISNLSRCALSYWLFERSTRRWSIDLPVFGRIWRFGRVIAPSSMITLLIGQTDKVILARFFDLSTFGVYALASNLAAAPMTLMSSYVSRILYPNFALAVHDETTSIRAQYYIIGRVTRSLMMLASGMFITLAPAIIELLYDDRYRSAARFLELLGLGGLFLFSMAPANEVLVACGKPKWTLVTNIARIVAILAACPVCYWTYGPIGIVYGMIFGILVGQCCLWWGLWREHIIDVAQEGRLFGLAVIGTAVGFAINFLLLIAIRHLA